MSIVGPRVGVDAVDPGELTVVRGELLELLRVCVASGASLGYLTPMSDVEAAQYWEHIVGGVRNATVDLLAARHLSSGEIVGTAQIRYESRSNARHRAEISKVMVSPAHRRRGIATALVDELEALARARSISLVVLDTSEGPGGARRFYELAGYTYAGGIPGFALDPDGTPAQNAIFYKELTG
ncbi:MAG TPA: GNAT family N-acetyltransferase [Acidimicrobiia bacterium]|nr:GNAT family N-acetyltransferase [Acidimicrobiia bacterium]